MTRRKSRQFNSSLQVKINHIEFEDKFLTKKWQCKRISVRRLPKELSNKQEQNLKKMNMHEFLRKFGTAGSTERTAVSGRLFLCYF